MKPGIYYDMTNADYHATTAINASFLKSWVMKSPMHAVNAKSSISQLVADLGTATHSEALEASKKNVVCSDEKTRATKAFKEHYELCKAQGKVLLPKKDFDMVKNMVHGMITEDGEIVGGLMNDSHCGKLLKEKDKICEASIFVQHEPSGLLLKCRPDIYSPKLGVMGDVKTAQDASPRGFGKALFRLGYHIQASHYLLCAKILGWEVKHWGFLTVEKESPFPAHFHALSEEVIEYGTNVVEAALMEIAEAKETKKYDLRWGTYTVQHLPDYLADI